MAWTDWPQELNVGIDADDDYMNDLVSGNLAHLYDRPYCKVFHNTTQTATEGDYTILMNTEDSDDDAMHSGSGGINLNRTGLWAFAANAEVAADADGYRYLRINNTNIIRERGRVGGGANRRINTFGQEYVVASTSVTAVFAHNAGGSLTMSSNPWMDALWMSAG